MQKTTVLITGATGGVGSHLTNYLASLGYNIALNSLRNKPDIDDIKMKFPEVSVKYYQANVGNEEENKVMVDKIYSDFGSIDVLINNAGINKNGFSWKLSIEDWNELINTNLTGIFLTTKHCIGYMRNKNWGRIINISSVLSSIGVPGTSAYSASKSALYGFAKSVAKEVAEKNITINNIALGYFDTGMLYEINEEIREKIRLSIPMKKFGNPLEICSLVEYIISENASYMTGQTLSINGGIN